MKKLSLAAACEDGETLRRRHLCLGQFIDEAPITGFQGGFAQVGDQELNIAYLLRDLNAGRCQLFDGRLERGDTLLIKGAAHEIRQLGQTGQLALLPEGRSPHLGPIWRHWQDLAALADVGLVRLRPAGF